MTECFLPPTSSPSEHRRVEHVGNISVLDEDKRGTVAGRDRAALI